MGEYAEEQAQLEKLPGWVPNYLAAWGSRFDPDGKQMRVKTAAALAGTSVSNVRSLRSRSERFQMLERIAREGGSLFLSSYMEAGVRTMAPELLEAFRALVQDKNAQVVLQGMKWAMDRPERVDVTSGGEPLGRTFEDALDRVYGNGDDDGRGDPDAPDGEEETEPDGAETN